jgi:hypothetical protein
VSARQNGVASSSTAGSSPKLFSTEATPAPSTMPLMALGVVDTAEAVPPVLPATVRPLTVPVGWVGSVTV